MFRKSAVLLILTVFLFSLTGCATARKQKDLEIQGLKNQLSVLESQVQSKDQEIQSLRDSLSAKELPEAAVETRVKAKKRIIHEVKQRPHNKDIQIALRNAGFDPGSIDGRMGKQTREAIRQFQSAHGLAVDGKVGKQTWSQLREYLYKQLK